jgi:hypothetical protein
MPQTKTQSLFESIVNVLIGVLVAVVTQIVIFPWFGIQTNMSQNLSIAAIFTLVSICRSYLLRRFFNWFHRG